MSTFFILAAASYLVGVALVETNITLGIGFYLASVFLSLILSPNKIYCLTFAVMSAYLVVIEVIRNLLMKREMKNLDTITPIDQKIKKQKMIFWVAKFIVFNLLYIPMLIFFPKLIYPGELSTLLVLGLVAGGQFGLVVYDLAYQEFIVKYWRRIRKNLSF
jgi:hypothetical protein